MKKFNYYFRLAKEQSLKLIYLKNLEMWVAAPLVISNSEKNIFIIKDFTN